MKNQDKTDLFENWPVPKAVANLAVPSVMATLVMVLYSIADTFFVGMLNNPVESAAVALAAPAILAFNAINNLFGVGTSSLISRLLGKRDYDNARRSSAFGFYSALFCSVLVSVFYTMFSNSVLSFLGADFITRESTERYLFWTVSLGSVPAIMNVVMSSMVRSEGCSMHASIGVISGCFLNIVLDPFFVLPQYLNMGASGAGCATFISNCVAMLYLMILTLCKKDKTFVSMKLSNFCFDKKISKEIFGVGLPSSLQNLLNVTGSIILNNKTAAFGAAAVSAMGISHKINLLPLYVSMGITQGVMSLIGYNWSSGNRKRMKDTIIFVLKISIVIGVLMSAVFFFCSKGLIRVFMDNDEIVMYGSVLLKLMSIGIVFMSVDFLGVAVFQAIGRGRYSLIFAVLRKIVLEIPAIIILNKIWPLYGMGLSQTISEFVLAIVAIFLLLRIFRESQSADF